MKNNFPIEGILKNGNTISLQCIADSSMVSQKFENYFHWNGEIRIITNPSLPTIKLLDSKINGDVCTVFCKEDYGKLDIKDKIVLDIGANIADTAIYFALKGAKKVIALEPFPKNFEIAKKNIELNNLSKKIDLILAGCASESGKITIDPLISGTGAKISKVKNGLKIPILSLDDLIKKYDIQSGILKLDCEGCENDIILNSSKESLQKFSQIYMEYHDGFRNLTRKLKHSNFSILTRKFEWTSMSNIKSLSGNIFAKLKTSN